jgi:hypothetical protein
MRNALSPIGMILMMIVMVIVLLLVARAWTSMAPTAVQITSPSVPGLQQDGTDGDEDGENEGPQRLPDLNDMKENTAEHAEQLEEARKQIDE